jgi:hypothetical protein
MSTPAFVGFPKIGRWSKNKIVITEKIDGTNGLISISRAYVVGDDDGADPASLVEQAIEAQLRDPTVLYAVRGEYNMSVFTVRAGSRERWITPAADNYGFARWVKENAAELVGLGEGNHFGEWWGSGIQRKYGLSGSDKRFSLFNVGRWAESPHGVYDKSNPDSAKAPIAVPGLGVVPTIYYGDMRDASGRCMIEESLRRLQFGGSLAVPGFKGAGKAGPEGVMVYFEALKSYTKVPFETTHKGQ